MIDARDDVNLPDDRVLPARRELIEALARAIVADWNMHAPRHTITFIQTHFLKGPANAE